MWVKTGAPRFSRRPGVGLNQQMPLRDVNLPCPRDCGEGWVLHNREREKTVIGTLRVTESLWSPYESSHTTAHVLWGSAYSGLPIMLSGVSPRASLITSHCCHTPLSRAFQAQSSAPERGQTLARLKLAERHIYRIWVSRLPHES